MKFDTGIRSRCALHAALAGALALGLAACDQQPKQKSPPPKFDQSLETAPADKSAGGNIAPQAAAPQGAVPLDIPDPGDVALASKVKSAITAEPALKAITVDVNAAAGVVTLNGTADTHANSDRAAKVALNVDGVRSVKNELIIVRGS